MATIASKFITNQLPTISGDCAGDEIVNDYFIDLTASQMVLGNIIDIGVLPANHTIGSARLICDDLDTNGTPLVALDVGILSGTPGDIVSTRTMGAEIFSADTSARTGVAAAATLASAFLIRSTGLDRSIGVKFQAAPATAAATGRIRLRVHMFANDPNVQF
jgi:hypothetical protein